MKIMLTAVLAVFLFTSSALAALKPNDTAPFFSLSDIAGNVFRLGDIIGDNNKEKGNGVILSFFASWCIPCRNELPMINSLVDELKGNGVKVVIVNVKENLPAIKALLADLKVDKPLVLSDPNGKVSEQYQVRFLPVTFFIGRDGKIRHIIYGEIGSELALRDAAGTLLK
jgi:thiol-disulfide isomerase/thioredoxin